MLSEFFKNKDLLDNDISSITDNTKEALAKEALRVKLFNEQYEVIMQYLSKADLLPKEDIMWKVLEGFIKYRGGVGI